ncbi:retaining alpha-galactosidase [Bacteroides faecalis]|uniref:Retaining alpha-galactosidase n=2 Tax=Bacteroides faecalis TaxID=2447885 RepID=A0A401LPS0_9BACE|nr:retaining alpha-galactosidase [Bacteroides faecalis]
MIACGMLVLSAQAQKVFKLNSPNDNLCVKITTGKQLVYDITCNGKQILAPSPISMTLDNGQVWGVNAGLAGSKQKKVDQVVPSPFYRAKEIKDRYNELVLRFKGNYSIEFRAYDDGVAYRFVSQVKKPFNVVNEQADFCFPSDVSATVPYVKRGNDGDFGSQFFNSFENEYSTDKLSKLNEKRLMFLPLVVEVDEGTKVCITETHLENYPGLYLSTAKGGNSLSGVFAPYPKKMVQGGHNNLQMLVEERENYIAKVDKERSFPWRIAIVTTSDKDLAASNLSYLLAAPSRLKDISWIKPGKVAWDWWNAWNLEGVDFATGVNNATYKAYIDFASAKGIEYVILDEGWAVNKKADLMQVVDDINLKELVGYAAAQNVGIILWAGYHAFDRDMENVCRHYSEMGVKGFKVDFMDRDDQLMTDFNYRAAAMCAKYKMILDLHGTSKPAGLNRTYPNVLNFEGVNGLEQLKWSPATLDQVKYDVMIPFIRQVSGPMDYTQGAMRNAVKGNYYPCYTEPMSQGTRCRQLALYVIFESPFNMLCDSPSNYMREPESTSFIAGIPTVWDESKVLDGKMGEYIVTARRDGDVWYVGGITNWDTREMTIDLSFLPDGDYQVEEFRDGVNAHRKGTDYCREEKSLPADKKLKVKMYPGGGYVAKIQIK